MLAIRLSMSMAPLTCSTLVSEKMRKAVSEIGTLLMRLLMRGWMELWGAAKGMSHVLLTVSFLRSNFRSHRVLEACQADG